MRQYIEDFLSLIQPRLCFACSTPLAAGEKVVCLDCLYHLPKTDFHHDPINPVAKIFWGRYPVEHAAACFYFRKGGKLQHLMHQFKYRKHPEIGQFIGNYYGSELRQSIVFKAVDMVIPVPLHWKKLRKRGYNQSTVFGQGIAESMNVPLENNQLIRQEFTETQTRKSRFNRWQNVENKFVIKDPDKLRGLTILLVDEVITTGATLEACCHAFDPVEDVKICIAAVAYAAV